MILLFLLSWAQALTCSVGSEKYAHLVTLFEKTQLSTDDSLLKMYRVQKTLRSVPGFKHLMTDSDISPACIKASMARIPNITAKRKVCQNSSETGQTIRIRGLTPPSKFSSGDKIISEELCMTDDMLDYVSWGYSQALACVNSLPTYKQNGVMLNPQSIFELFNGESAYGFYLFSTRGVGAGQLTTSGVSDFLPRQRFHFILQEVISSDSPSCAPFKELAQKPVLMSGTGRSAVIRHCQFLSVGEGMGKNFLYSALHLAAKEWEVIALLKKYNHKRTPRRIIDQLLFIAYSRHGLDGVERILKRRPNLETMTAKTFYLTHSRTYPYLSEIRDKTLQFLTSYNDMNLETATYEDFEQGLCAN
jgi:hypothetical protein